MKDCPILFTENIDGYSKISLKENMKMWNIYSKSIGPLHLTPKTNQYKNPNCTFACSAQK